jgi:FtsZ-binding cell division protein ZapB
MTIASQVEETDILAIVDPLAKNSRGDADVRAMASFLKGIAQERRRLKESAAAAGTRLRDAQRARDTEKQRADALQERAAQLQQKLDALTELEKSLSDRQSPPR